MKVENVRASSAHRFFLRLISTAFIFGLLVFSSDNLFGITSYCMSVTGGQVYSGSIQVAPYVNYADNPNITLSGKRPYAGWGETVANVDECEIEISINGTVRATVPLGNDLNWSINIDNALSQGNNNLTIVPKNAAGNNICSNITIIIVYDTTNLVPGIENLQMQDNLDGYSCILDWSTYDESAVPYLEGYNIYYDTMEIVDPLLFQPVAAVSKGTKNFTIGNLTINTTYYVAVVPYDVFGNMGGFEAIPIFTKTGVSKPIITGGVLPTGVITPGGLNMTNQSTVTIAGGKSTNTSLWINGVQQDVDVSSDSWSINIELSEGDNVFEIWLQDSSGARSQSVSVNIKRDTSLPVVISVQPENGSTKNKADNVNRIILSLDCEANEIDLEGSVLSIRNSAGIEVAGTWSASSTDLVFIPESGFEDSTYTLNIQLKDKAGNVSESVESVFELDATPPPSVSSLKVNGMGNGTYILLDWSGYDEGTIGDVDHYIIYEYDMDAVDEYELAIVSKEVFTFKATGLVLGSTYGFRIAAVDRAGNISDLTEWVYGIPLNVNPPEDVTNLEVSATSTTLTFTWTPPEGTITGYMIYFNGAEDPELLSSNKTSYKATGLNPDTEYSFRIVSYYGEDPDISESPGITVTGTTASFISSPELTGSILETGIIKSLPFVNMTNESIVKLTGKRSIGTSVWINGTQIIEIGGDDWEYDLNLIEGQNSFSLWLQDDSGNKSDVVSFDILLDTVAPSVMCSYPKDKDEVADIQSNTQIDITLDVSGINLEKSVHTILNSRGETVDGSWSYTHGDGMFIRYDILSFNRTTPFPDSIYTVTVAPVDKAGNRGEPYTYTFRVDSTPPAAIDNLSVAPQGKGTACTLSWLGYDEAAAGDVVYYLIYYETAPFTNVTGLSPKGRINAGNFTTTIEELTRGSQYWFAVVPVDNVGNMQTAVSAQLCIPIDVVPPDDITDLQASCNGTAITFTWAPPSNPDGDIAGLRVWFDDASEPEVLPLTQTSILKTGLNPASSHHLTVVVYDTTGNTSKGVSISAATLMDNPGGLSAKPFNGYVELTWNDISDTSLLRYYAVYVSTSDFTSVAGMTPVMTTIAPKANVTGLTNNTTYYFAVTAVNISGGEKKSVNTVSAKPVAETEGPEITNVEFNGFTFLGGMTLTKSGSFAVIANDASGIGKVEFWIDGNLVATTVSALTYYLDINALTDGSHTLIIKVYDTIGNVTTKEYTFRTELAKPLPPHITDPTGSVTVNKAYITITGTSEKNTTVAIYRNADMVLSPVSVDYNGKFTATVTLVEGDNHIRATASNRAGESDYSIPVVVTLDTNLPTAPFGISAQSKPGGVISLSWHYNQINNLKGFNVYRTTSSISSVKGLTPINSEPFTGTSYDDLPSEDGTYYYYLTTVTTSNNESLPSQEIKADSDRTLPYVTSVEYTTNGKYDVSGKRFGVGTVTIRMTVSEKLSTTPFLTITPDGGIPNPIELTKAGDLVYTGMLNITNQTTSGLAYAVFSGRDMVGNRGTDVNEGRTLTIDTCGPNVRRLYVEPAVPIKNSSNNPVTVTVVIGLDEAAFAPPELSYQLSKGGGAAVTDLSRIAASNGDAETWRGTLTLPATAGADGSEILSFIYKAHDDLENESASIGVNNSFEIYQGALPPLDAPTGLSAKGLAKGSIRLTWNQVTGASGYKIYRMAPGETELTEYQTLQNVLQFTDMNLPEGQYSYAVASIRTVNNEEAVSARSAVVSCMSDATAPNAPYNLQLQLTGQGIVGTWQAPQYTETVTFNFYRTDKSVVTSTEGLTPKFTGLTGLTSIDSQPSIDEHYYFVTAVDASGNESLPSNIAYLNFELLPVASITVLLTGETPPLISWTHSGQTINGFDLFLGEEGSKVKINSELIKDKSWTDTGYTGDERLYSIVAVDNNGKESLARTIFLPNISFAPQDGCKLMRGVMNRLFYEVKNNSTKDITNCRLKVSVAGRTHLSESFSVTSGANSSVGVPVGGYKEIQDTASVTATLEITPNQGELVSITKDSTLNATEGVMIMDVLNDPFTRGGTGSVRFTLQNTGTEEIEILTGTGSGANASPDVNFYLLDSDGNVLSTVPLKQIVGDNIINLANGNTVARIPAGVTFTSAPVSLPVPFKAPDKVYVKVSIANLWYHNGQEDQVKMDGIETRRELSLIDAPYYGEITSITPESSTEQSDITIKGRALDRDTKDPLPNMPLGLYITLNGFEKKIDVTTGSDGTFTYVYKPQEGQSGVYYVRVMHPDIMDKPVMGQFVITDVSIDTPVINLNIPRNYEFGMDITATTGIGTNTNNLKLVYEAADQLDGILPAGVHVTLPAPIALSSGNSSKLHIVVWADNQAAEYGILKLKLKSDENTWATVTINTHFAEAMPAVFFSKDHIETGVAQGDSITETLEIENKGFASLNDATLSIVNEDGTAAPSWVGLNTPASTGNIGVGETRDVSITFNPPSSLSDAVYTFKLRVKSSNSNDTYCYIYCSVTQAGQGNALFKVTDLFTGSLDSGGNLINGLSGASIYIQNEKVTTVEQTLASDSVGEAMFRNLPTGIYFYRVTADNHQQTTGTFWVKPGITGNVEVFLDYNLVTVSWSVKETTIEDKYEIVLQAVYETDVPAPVVVANPASITMPDMKKGDVYHGEYTLTNYGLVTAKNLQFDLMPDNVYFKFELQDNLPTELKAKETKTISYRIICLKSFDDDEDSTGGGLGSGCYCISHKYVWYCPGDDDKTQPHYGYNSYCVCQPAVSSVVSGDTAPVFYSSGGGGGGGPVYGGGSGSGTGSGGPECPPYECKCMYDPITKESKTHCSLVTHSAVNLTNREYTDSVDDLRIKAAGGYIAINRSYYHNEWLIYPVQKKLKFSWDVDNILPEDAINMDRTISCNLGSYVAEYSANFGEWVFNDDDGNTITLDNPDNYSASGWTLKKKYGDWTRFDHWGKILSYGDLNGAIAVMVYEPVPLTKDSRVVAVNDRRGRQVYAVEYYDSGRISRITDIAGRSVRYDDALLINEVRKCSSEGCTREYSYSYNSDGRLISKTDSIGRTYIINYDDYGYVQSELDPSGKGYSFKYSYDESKDEIYAQVIYPSGMIEETWSEGSTGIVKRKDVNGVTIKKAVSGERSYQMTDARGGVTYSEYDTKGNTIKVIYPDGTVARYEYDLRFNKVRRKIDQRGIITDYIHNADGNVTMMIEAKGTPVERITDYTYDEDGNMTSVRIGNNPAAIMNYDDYGNMLTQTDTEGHTTVFTYNALGNMLTRTDAGNNTWTYTYDEEGRMLTQADPLNHVTTYSYDKAGRRVEQKDPMGGVTKFDYDISNNLIKTTDALGGITAMAYSEGNKLINRTDPEGHGINYEYDLDGRLVNTIDGNGNTVRNEYDTGAGLGAGCSSCSGGIGGSSTHPSRIYYPTFTREFMYDLMGRKLRETDITNSAALSTSYEYDESGNMVKKTDRMGKITTYEYDELNRMVKVADPLGGVTSYAYDSTGNMSALTDARGNTTRFTYDTNNRLVKETRPMGQETVYTYNAVGALSRKTNPNGSHIEYDYDNAGRLLESRNYNTSGAIEKTVSYSYDANGNLLTYGDGTTSAVYTYDELNRKLTETVNYGAFSLGYTYEYFKNGLKKTYKAPDGVTYSYSYDNANNLTSMEIPGTGVITRTYKWNRPELVTYPGGSTRAYAYDELMHVTGITSKDPGQNIIMNYSYTYDNADNILMKQTEHGDYNYTYDDLYRLTGATNPNKPAEGFTYDPVGNRLTSAAISGEWGYNANNELKTYPSVSVDYDANGNTVKKTEGSNVTDYLWDAENRLMKVEKDGAVAGAYYYDPFGRRLSKTVGGATTYFFYSDEGLAGEFNVQGQAIKTYGFAPNSTWTTDPVLMKISNQYYFYHNDHLGTPQKMTAVNGAVVWSAKYESFGKAAVDAGNTIENNLRFPGQYYDAETGENYNRSRYYNFDAGRYLSNDPINRRVGLNLYEYAKNNTLIFIDPYGESAIKCTASQWKRIPTISPEEGQLISIDYNWEIDRVEPGPAIPGKEDIQEVGCYCVYKTKGCVGTYTRNRYEDSERTVTCTDGCNTWQKTEKDSKVYREKYTKKTSCPSYMAPKEVWRPGQVVQDATGERCSCELSSRPW